MTERAPAPMHAFGVALLLAMALPLAACTMVVAPPAVPGVATVADAEAAWARVLTQAVDDSGRVDFSGLAAGRSDLDSYLAFVARHSPASAPGLFPTVVDRLAYYINSYNALAMYGVIATGMPNSFERLLDRARFFKLTKFRIGGEDISLYDYENDIIRPLGEPRVHFALNCMAAGCPRLPRQPFVAATLDRVLDEVSREFFNSAKHVQVDGARKVARLSEILRFYTEDFVNPRVANSLIEYVNRYRTAPIPSSFEVEFIPYDWTVNRQ